MSPPKSSSHPRRTPIALWRLAQNAIIAIFERFNARATRTHTLDASEYNLFRRWLCAAEALMRRVLLIEAALITTQIEPLHRHANAFAAASSGMPRVSFRVTVAERQRSRRRNAFVRTPAAEQRSNLPLVRRLEALIRAYENPTPIARRLAARIRRNTNVLARALDDAWMGARNIIGTATHDALVPIIDAAYRLLADTS